MSKVKNTLISAMAIGLLAGSAVGVAAQTGDEPSSASTGCEEPLVKSGVYEGVNDFDDAAQAYRVVVPQGYADLAPAPLILFVAAGGGSLEGSFEWWRPYLDETESVFVVVESVGMVHRAPETLAALIDELIASYCVDETRVHAMGQSSSAGSAARLACYAPDRIGSLFVGIAGLDCTPERPVPLMAMTGDPDRGTVTRSVERWAEAYECSSDPVVEDLGSGVTRTTHQGCLADIVLYDVEDVGHGFIRKECLGTEVENCYANDVFDQLREVERFFAEHPLPAAE